MTGPETATRLTTDHAERSERVTHVVLHHAATTSLASLEYLMEPGGRTVSAHYAVKDRERVLKVPLDRRAYSLGSPRWDSKAVTVECANESVRGWTISAASHESLALIVAHAAERFGFTPHRDGPPETWTVLGHREVYTIHGASYATACPGGLDLDLVTRRARELMTLTPESEHEMRLIRTPDSSVFLVTAVGVKPITSAAHLALLQRVLKAEPGEYVNLTAAEAAIVRGYFTPPAASALEAGSFADELARRLSR